MNDNFCVYLDEGHGGLKPGADPTDPNSYTTNPNKMHKHKKGEFHGGGYFYEGVFNRLLGQALTDKFDQGGIKYIRLAHPYKDTSLWYRINKANWRHRLGNPGILFSLHANASPSHRARGIEWYTSPGVTKADKLSDLYHDNLKELFGDTIKYRLHQNKAGAYDKEARFYMLVKSRMPAILFEDLFFDNFEDAKLLIDEEVIDRLAEAKFRTAFQYYKLWKDWR